MPVWFSGQEPVRFWIELHPGFTAILCLHAVIAHLVSVAGVVASAPAAVFDSRGAVRESAIVNVPVIQIRAVVACVIIAPAGASAVAAAGG